MNKRGQIDFELDEEWIYAAGLGLLAAIIVLIMYHLGGVQTSGFWKIAAAVTTFIVATIVCRFIFGRD